LSVDSGLCAFARLPEREHQLLVGIARNAACKLTLAYTLEGEIVGQVTLAPASSRWEGEEDCYEVAVEVSSSWRRRGIAQQLLAFALEWDVLEKGIVVGMGLSWHWDMEGVGLSVFRYREMIARLFAGYGFVEYLTNEPNIRMDAGNIFLARFGRSVDAESIDRFFQLLLQADTLPGR
jgi:GNAT superfamily N-acetyltransferase